MRADELLQALPLLPPALRDRTGALLTYARSGRCDQCQRVADAIDLALMAARYDEFGAAEQLIDTAHGLVRDHHGQSPSDGCPLADLRRGPTGGRGWVERWADRTTDLIAAADASWKSKVAGIAYVVSNGQFGLRGRPTGRLDPTGPSRSLINELRAVEFLLAGFAERPERLTVLVDSAVALSYLHRWQSGTTAAMPAGYSLRPRIRAAQPTLVRLAELVASLPGVAFQHVKGHAGHPLNEAADALCSMARRRVAERFDTFSRAHGLVDAFLSDWHSTMSPRLEGTAL